MSHHAELDYKTTETGGFDVDLMGVSCGVEVGERSWMQGFQQMEILQRTALPDGMSYESCIGCGHLAILISTLLP